MINEVEKLKGRIREKLRADSRVPAMIAQYMRENGAKGGRNGTHADKVRAGKLGAAARWGPPLRSQKGATN